MNVGNKAYELVCELFPICRSITGNGVRQTLEVIKRELPEDRKSTRLNSSH